ncbi:RNA-directed DNA polymerase [Rossellomorea arthrocnemi]
MKRNELDFILTELLPVETSNMFTYTHFYEYLLKNNEEIKEIEKNISLTKYTNNAIFKNGWHASPLKYFVNKGNSDLREISILNPFSAMEIFFFIKLYNTNILDTLNKMPSFSLRSHYKNNELYYKSSNNGLVEYEDQIEKKDKFTKALESSGIFFNLKPYVTLGHFFNSDDWFKLNSQYKYFAKIDIKDCFGSIYTHTFKWILSQNTIDSKNFTNNNMYSVIDRLLQHINNSISNGIIVGPEFSRMIAEILLQQIDFEVYNNLVELDYKNGVDYNVCRYVDDIYIFSNEEYYIDQIIQLYKQNSSKYQLKFNDLKSIRGKLPYVWNEWKNSTKAYLNILNSRSFNTSQDQTKHLLKARNFTNYRNLASLKEDLQNLLAIYPNDKEKVVSYIYSAIFNKLRNNKKEKLFRENVSNNEIEKVIDYIFYLYSFAPTFRNTRKLICIEYLFKEELDKELIGDILQKTIRKYEHIFLYSNIPDFIDLLPIFRKNNIELSIPVEERIWNSILKDSDPILAANFLIYSRYNIKYFEEIKKDISLLIEREMSVINNSKNILWYRELWWLFIFIDCPYLESQTTFLLKSKLNLLKPNDNNISSKIINILYKFLTDSAYLNKFIDWDVETKNIVEDITYFTYERTIFKNYDTDKIIFEY